MSAYADNEIIMARYDFHGRIRSIFESEHSAVVDFESAAVICIRAAENKHLTDEGDIDKAMKLGEYIKKGMSWLRAFSSMGPC